MATTQLSAMGTPEPFQDFLPKTAGPVWKDAKVVGFDTMSGKPVSIQGRILFLTVFMILFLSSLSFGKDVDLEWDHDGDCEHYKIYRGYSSGSWPELLATIDCPTKTYTDTDVPHGNLYWVVTADNSVDESNPSNEVLLAYYYAKIKYEYSSTGMILYKGENADINAVDAETDWVITKYYYVDGQITEMRVRVTSWTDRALGW